MANQKTREIRVKKRPHGMPQLSDFELAETDVPTPGPGEVLVRNSYMSVNPYMRARMMDWESYVPPFQIGEVLSGGATGQVVASNNPAFKVGDFVSHMGGWREWTLSNGMDFQKIDPNMAPLSAYLGTFGMPGLTAYGGLLRAGALKDGETVFVSRAAGAGGCGARPSANAR